MNWAALFRHVLGKQESEWLSTIKHALYFRDHVVRIKRLSDEVIRT
jgi:hypothetical protein